MGVIDKFLQNNNDKATRWRSLTPLIAAGVLVIGGVLAATINLGSWIELGGGVKNTDLCAQTPVTSFDQNFITTMSGNPSRITKITVEGVPVSCAGKYLKLTVYGSSSQVLESVVWLLAKVGASDTSINAITDGSTTTNTSTNNISQNFPASEANPLGLTLEALDPAAIASFNLESSDELLTED